MDLNKKGFDTGFVDTSGKKLRVGDKVDFLGHIGEIDYMCGAFGIYIPLSGIPWCTLRHMADDINWMHAHFVERNNNFVSFYELVANIGDVCLVEYAKTVPYTKNITATKGVSAG